MLYYYFDVINDCDCIMINRRYQRSGFIHCNFAVFVFGLYFFGFAFVY